METARRITEDVIVTPELANEIVDGLSKIEEGTQQLGAAVLALTAPKPAAAAERVDDTAAEPRVWATDEVSLREYDAEQLTQLRVAHRADKHAPDGCDICTVLARRLGSLEV